MPATQRVALLGLGTMGRGMAANLLRAGLPLTVWNRTRAKADAFAAQGATIADSPAAAAAGAQVILAMLADDEASRSAWLGPQGALAAAPAEAILVECSTVSPAWIGELADAAAARGLKLLDAPVTGSRVQAAAGQLTLLVGGDADAIAAAEPALQAISKEIVHLGPTGSGAKLKLVNNFLCGVQIASLAEAIPWLERSGLNVEQSLGFLKSAAPGSPLIAGISARMMARDYDVNFVLSLMTKDLVYAQAAAAETGVDLTTASNARSLFERAIQQGHGEQDMSAVVEPVRAANL